MISIQNLTRKYGDVVAVDRVSTEIQRGQIVGLLGHNGAGKTTVMKILTGYLDATDGAVKVAGFDVDTDRIEAQKRIGYLPENAPLYDEMLVQEYLVMVAELRGVPAAEIPARVGEAIVATGLNERLLSPIHTLSKGLRQRVGIAQAILHRPDVLVLDEPTNGLDPMQIRAIRSLIQRLGQRTTIILSTHILQEIEAVCDRVLIMIQGALVADAPMGELLVTRRVRLELAPGTGDVSKTLGGIDGVTEVSSLGADSWGLGFQGETPPVPAIVAACAKSGWTIAAVGPEHRTLESVYKELQDEHARRVGGAA